MSLKPNKLLDLYNKLISDGDLRPDPAQMGAVELLQSLADRLDGYQPSQPGTVAKLLHNLLPAEKQMPQASGLYIYGGVGRGKSMLMDLFFVHVNVVRKRRVHFHQFMLEIHERLHRLQGGNDILPELARELAEETWLLCFDEFHVSNIADAMILGRLFASLFENGVIIVSTSNWAPDDLYKNGLQRDRFLPFIDLIKQKMVIYRLAGDTDHRYEQIRGLQSYFSPLGSEITHKLQSMFLQMTDDAEPEAMTLPVLGRTLKITHAAKGVGFFNFDELCMAALGAADYLAIAECLHTVFLDGVPKFTLDMRNETLRFMTLIDTLYEAKVKFFMASAVPVDRLAPPGEHAFAFQRTLSRLMEMQGDDYRHMAHLAPETSA